MTVPGAGHMGPVANADIVTPLLLDAIATDATITTKAP